MLWLISSERDYVVIFPRSSWRTRRTHWDVAPLCRSMCRSIARLITWTEWCISRPMTWEEWCIWRLCPYKIICRGDTEASKCLCRSLVMLTEDVVWNGTHKNNVEKKRDLKRIVISRKVISKESLSQEKSDLKKRERRRGAGGWTSDQAGVPMTGLSREDAHYGYANSLQAIALPDSPSYGNLWWCLWRQGNCSTLISASR